nr:hypothetical protein [Tanacetum cinerariifolium]
PSRARGIYPGTLPLDRVEVLGKQILRGRLLASFQDREYEGGDTRSQGGIKDNVSRIKIQDHSMQMISQMISQEQGSKVLLMLMLMLFLLLLLNLLIPSPTPPTQPSPPSQDLPSTSQVQPTPPPSLIAQPPSPPQQPQPSQDAEILMDLLHNLLDTCTTLTKRVENPEQDKIAQALEITKLKQRIKKLERRNKLKVSKLMRLKKVGTAQRVDTSDDTVMDDVSKQGRIIASMDADVDVTLKDVVDIAKEVDADAKIEESVDVQGRQAESQAQIYQIDLKHADKVLSMQDDEVEPAELQEVVEVKEKEVVIRDLEETATPSAIIHSEAKSKHKGKGILDDVIDQVQRKEKEDNVVMRYQALKRKPQTEAQAKKNMMIYLRNTDGFKMDYFKGMKYDDIRLIFKKYVNSNVAFLEKTREQMEEEDSKALKRISESQEDKATKKQKLDEELTKLKRHLQIVLNDEDDVYTEATPLAHDFLLTTLTYMFKIPDVQAQAWKNQRKVHGLAKVKSWRPLESCGVHIITFTSTQMILLVERRYPLIRFTLDQMLNNVRLKVEEKSEVSLELLRISFGVDVAKDFKEKYAK